MVEFRTVFEQFVGNVNSNHPFGLAFNNPEIHEQATQ